MDIAQSFADGGRKGHVSAVAAQERYRAFAANASCTKSVLLHPIKRNISPIQTLVAGE